ncbi:MAG TPA: hypothetical protein VN931_08285 [Fibrobacteria bacterium]|nr:hypothetical protein [Fibrobacteria bacterium]
MPDLRIWKRLLPVLLPVLLAGCGQGRVAEGTTGTEAGNALTAILLLPGGGPAAHALVAIRPSTAVDSSTAATWIHAETDEQGLLQTRFGAGSWTLEARLSGLAVRIELNGTHDTSLSSTLNTVQPLRCTVLGGSPGTVVSLPGLARSTRLDSASGFAFDSLPPDPTPVDLGGAPYLTLNPGPTPLVVSVDAPQVVYQGGVALAGAPNTTVSPWLVADSLLSDPSTVFTDSTGSEIPVYIGMATGTDRTVWLGLPVSGKVSLRKRVSGPAPSSPFSPGNGFSFVWLADTGTTILGAFQTSSSSTLVSPVDSGAFLRSSLGGSLGTIVSGLPDTGVFSVGLRARQLTPTVGSIWALDWTDSLTAEGVQVGVGNGWLSLQAGGRDTAVAWDPGESWFQLGLSWDGQTLRLAADGVEKIVIVPAASTLADRSSWSLRDVGLGGSLDLSHLIVLDRVVSDTGLSRDPAPLR